MGKMTVQGVKIDVDIVAELEAFSWESPRWTGDKLLAASPFRDEDHPSFFVRLEEDDSFPAGVWSDSGNFDDDWTSGNFPKLLSYLMNVTYEEAEDYLLEKYGPERDKSEIVLRPITLSFSRKRSVLSEEAFEGYLPAPSDYLLNRGITAETQRAAGVYHDQSKVVIPWRSATGRLENVKYRSTQGKTFWYAKDATPIRDLVYGIDLIWSDQATEAILCEAEIDAMSWRVAGYYAIACGGSAFSERKQDIIASSPLKTLYVAPDNDKMGAKLLKNVNKTMTGRIELREITICDEFKDANECLVKSGVESLRESFCNAKRIDVRRSTRKVF